MNASVKSVMLLDGITSLTANLGTARDKSTSVYYEEPVVDHQQLLAMYRTSWLARKIVDIPAMDSYRRWRTWQASDDQVEDIEDEEKRLDLKAKMLRTETMARLYGGAALYYDLGDDASKPAPKKIGKGGVRFCTVLSHWHLVPGEVEVDPMQPNFGQPKWYEVAGASQGIRRIHPSRLVIRYGTERPDLGLFGYAQQNSWGDSVLYAMRPAVEQFDSTAANLASLIFESKIDVISVAGLMELVGDPQSEARLLARYQHAATMKGNNGMLLLDRDTETYEQKNATFTTLPDILDRFAQNAAGGADIPMTRLFGQSPGGMNSTGDADLRNYYDAIASAQTLRIGPSMETLDNLLIQSALGSRPVEIHYVWSSLWQIDDTELAALGKAHVETVTGMQATGLFVDEVLKDTLVSLMVDASVIPGLEASIVKHGDPVDVDQPEEPAGGSGGDKPAPKDGKPKTATVAIVDATPMTLYVSRSVKNGAEILRWARAQGFTNTLAVEDLHVTIAYSTTPIDWMSAGAAYEDEITLSAGGPRLVEKFGDANVLLFAGGSLKWRHEEFIERGASWDHDTFQPHITISYGEAPEGVEPYQGRIVLGPELFKEVDTEWLAGKKKDSPFLDEQARAPKGAPNGGQWVKGGGGSAPAVGSLAYMEELLNTSEEAYYAGTATLSEHKAVQKAYAKGKNASDVAKLAADDFGSQFMTSDELTALYESGGMTADEYTAAASKLLALKAPVEEGIISIGLPPSPDAQADAMKAKAMAAVASSAYPAEKIEALLDKSNKEMTQGEYKKVLAYKKALEAEKLAYVDKVLPPAPPTATQLKATYESGLVGAQAAKENLVVQYGAGAITKAEMTDLTAHIDATENAKTLAAEQQAKTLAAHKAALGAVTTAAYPAEQIEAILQKDPATWSQGEYKKALAYKKALVAIQTPPESVVVPPKTTIDPMSSEALTKFGSIGSKMGHGMKADTVQKLVTGEYQPDPNKPWQAAVKSATTDYVNGVKPVIKSGPSYNVLSGLDTEPPPTTNSNTTQKAHATYSALTNTEENALMSYTGHVYSDVNKPLRTGSGEIHHLTSALDAAIAKSVTTTDIVVTRGIKGASVDKWLSKLGQTDFTPGVIITDNGYASTTRKHQVAANFAGNGYGFKITVPKGSKLFPLKSISQHAQEDEFLLPRGSRFRVDAVNGNIITMSVVS